MLFTFVALPDNHPLTEKFRKNNHVVTIGQDGKAVPLCYCSHCGGYTGENRKQGEDESSLVRVPHHTQDHARLSKKPGIKLSKGSASRKFINDVTKYNTKLQHKLDNIDRLLRDKKDDETKRGKKRRRQL